MTKPIRYLIVDDESLNQKNLHYAIAEQNNWELLGLASSAAQARILLQQTTPDVIFLDIQMPRESGLSLARELISQEHPPLIIFVTAYNEHAIEAFRLHALDYLLKPINDEHLQQALKRTEEMLALRQQNNYALALRQMMRDEETPKSEQEFWTHIGVRSIGRIDRVAVADILWIEAQGNYMRLHLRDQRIMYRASMTRLETHLNPAEFARTHRSTIVRLDQIKRLEVLPDHSYQAHLQNRDIIPVSDRHIARIKQYLNSA